MLSLNSQYASKESSDGMSMARIRDHKTRCQSDCAILSYVILCIRRTSGSGHCGSDFNLQMVQALLVQNTRVRGESVVELPGPSGVGDWHCERLAAMGMRWELAEIEHYIH